MKSSAMGGKWRRWGAVVAGTCSSTSSVRGRLGAWAEDDELIFADGFSGEGGEEEVVVSGTASPVRERG